MVTDTATPTIKFGVAGWSLPIDGPWGCRIAADCGLDGVQLDVGDSSRGFPLTRACTQDAWQQAASDAGVELISVAVNALCRHGMNVRPDSADGRLARASIAAGIHAAHDLGLDLVQLPAFEGGFVRTAEERENLADALRFGCRLANDYGVTVSTENVLDPDEFRELRDRVDADNFRLFFDMQNYVLNRGLDQMHVLEELYDDVVQVHAKDGVDGRLSSAIVGTGDARVAEQIQLLLGKGYTGWITLENFYDTAPIAGGNGDPVADLATDSKALRRLTAIASRPIGETK
ncbi:MAG: sugar phosphate isomerase/epimerase family protein [Ilumatobacteraceae bacterium]